MDAGECVAVVGPSGSGKTTLAHLLTGIEQPTEGEVVVDGKPLHALSQDALAAWRGRRVGIVFQFFQLLPTLTVAENVMLPMDFRAAFPRRERRARALALLERLRIADQADKLPAALSGGQQQRAAIARALANDPALIVADEPTGNLDSATALEVMALAGVVGARGQDRGRRDARARAGPLLHAHRHVARRPRARGHGRAYAPRPRGGAGMIAPRWIKLWRDAVAARGRLALIVVAMAASVAALATMAIASAVLDARGAAQLPGFEPRVGATGAGRRARRRAAGARAPVARASRRPTSPPRCAAASNWRLASGRR